MIASVSRPEAEPRADTGAPAVASRPKVCVLVNPVAGRTDPDELEERLQARADHHGLDLEVRRTGGEGDAARWAEERSGAGNVRLVAAGGDGTLCEVVTGVLRSGEDRSIGFVPAGSANVMAEVLGLPDDRDEAIDLAFTGEARAIDVGELDGGERYFLIAAALGFPADTMDGASRALKRRVGFAAYVVAAFQSLGTFFRREPVVLEIDGRPIRTNAHTVVVANAGRFPGVEIEFVPGATASDGHFDVLLVEARSPLRLLRHLVALARGRRDGPRIERGRDIRLRTRSDQAFQIDGDPLDVDDPAIRVKPGAAFIVTGDDARV